MIVTTMQRDILTNVPGIEIFLGDDCPTQLGCMDYLGVRLSYSTRMYGLPRSQVRFIFDLECTC